MEQLARTVVALSPRQARIVELLSHGLQGKEIAARMHISLQGVKNQLRRARLAVGAGTTAQLVAMVAVQRERNRMRAEAAIPVAGTLPAAWRPSTARQAAGSDDNL